MQNGHGKSTGFRFGRLIPEGTFHPLILKKDVARQLGDRMVKGTPTGDSQIPAGYTYLGQFIDHDITRDITEGEADTLDGDIEQTPDSELVQGRSPSLDLDSLYGSPNSLASGVFKIGETTPAGGHGHSRKSLQNDLVRGNGEQAVLIPDRRNDENLAVAQMHLVWMLFHNVMFRHVKEFGNGDVLAEARDLVVKHYQHIVLHDFVRRLIQEKVYEETLVDARRSLLHCCAGEVPFMPLEFSVAAFRLGHSMVRPTYTWNINFTGATLRQLFEFSSGSGRLSSSSPLPSNWIPDFRRLFDLRGYAPDHLREARNFGFNTAKKIDPYLALDLGKLPGNGDRNLAFLNLRRGSLRGLPSGQDAAQRISPGTVLGRQQMEAVFSGDGQFHALMEKFGLYERTPLWLYILIEAKAREDGERLGEVGSRILAETFLTLAICSQVSIFGPGRAVWTPRDAESITKPSRTIDTMASLLEWVDRSVSIVNPLEDSRN